MLAKGSDFLNGVRFKGKTGCVLQKMLALYLLQLPTAHLCRAGFPCPPRAFSETRDQDKEYPRPTLFPARLRQQIRCCFTVESEHPFGSNRASFQRGIIPYVILALLKQFPLRPGCLYCSFKSVAAIQAGWVWGKSRTEALCQSA